MASCLGPIAGQIRELAQKELGRPGQPVIILPVYGRHTLEPRTGFVVATHSVESRSFDEEELQTSPADQRPASGPSYVSNAAHRVDEGGSHTVSFFQVQ